MISYILLSIYFFIKIIAGIKGILTYDKAKKDNVEIYKLLSVKKLSFYLGVIENGVLLLLVNLLYFLK